jgi:Flp pilus assembly protein TadG
MQEAQPAVDYMQSSSYGERRRSRRRGSAVVELAIGISLLWTCFAGIFEFGHSIYCYNALQIAVESGAMFASTVSFDAAAQTFIQQIRNMTVYGNPNGGTAPVAPGLSTSNVSVTWTTDASGMPDTMTVAIAGYTCNAVFRTFTWNGKPSATTRFMGVYKP